MIHLKTNPIGIDAEIQGIQEYLYEKLNDWNLEAFGRAEIIDKKPRVFYKKNDYKEVLFLNETSNGKFFFVDSEKTKLEEGFLVTDVDLYFLLDVKKIKPNVNHRADEEIRVEILNYLQKKYKEIDITKGQKVLSNFETKLNDMQPYHFLKFSFEVKYQSILNKC